MELSCSVLMEQREENAAEGLPQTAEEVVRAYADTVYALALSQLRSRTDADDVFQEVFLAYVRRKPEFESQEHQKAWFLRVTLNCCKKLWRFRKRRKPSRWRKRFLWRLRRKPSCFWSWEDCRKNTECPCISSILRI